MEQGDSLGLLTAGGEHLCLNLQRGTDSDGKMGLGILAPRGC